MFQSLQALLEAGEEFRWPSRPNLLVYFLQQLPSRKSVLMNVHHVFVWNSKERTANKEMSGCQHFKICGVSWHGSEWTRVQASFNLEDCCRQFFECRTVVSNNPVKMEFDWPHASFPKSTKMRSPRRIEVPKSRVLGQGISNDFVVVLRPQETQQLFFRTPKLVPPSLWIWKESPRWETNLFRAARNASVDNKLTSLNGMQGLQSKKAMLSESFHLWFFAFCRFQIKGASVPSVPHLENARIGITLDESKSTMNWNSGLAPTSHKLDTY